MELVFITGSALRRVFIKGRRITLLTAETGFQPLQIDLDKLDQKDLDKMKMDNEFINELKELRSEEDIAIDIIKDFKKTGWRLLKKSG